jgi:hypothetical protein
MDTQVGTPEAFVVKTELLAVASPASVLADEAYTRSLAVIVVGKTVVDHAGVALDPLTKTCPAVAVPANTLSLEASDQTIPPLDAVKEPLLVPPLAKLKGGVALIQFCVVMINPFINT